MWFGIGASALVLLANCDHGNQNDAVAGGIV
jgi:hypothetical protein